MRFHFALVVLSTLVAARPSTPRHQWPLGPWSETESSPADDLYGALAGSTIEVVRTQATYFTRGAAFGPRVTQAEGLRGTLVPISAYHHEKDAIFACASNSSDRIFRESTNAPPADWIALVERGGGCSFVEKVRTAQGLGAVAVVVGDEPSEDWKDNPEKSPEESDPGKAGKRLLTMFANGDASDIEVPSTFVTRPSFLDLRRLILELKADSENSGKPHKAVGIEIIISRDDTVWEWPLLDLALILLLLPSLMTLTTVIIHRIRQAQIQRRERAPELVVQNLPCLIVRGNGVPWEKVEGTGFEAQPRPASAEDSPPPEEASTSRNRMSHPPATTMLAPESSGLLPPGRSWFYSDECAICLSNFVEGDTVRVLPCAHIFHRAEIDDWLILQRKVCPVCKRDITVPVPPGALPSDDVPADHEGEAVNSGDPAPAQLTVTDSDPERVPLLSGSESAQA